MQKGTHHSDESKAKISATRLERGLGSGPRKGFYHNAETRQRMSDARKGYKEPEEVKLKRIAAIRAYWAKRKGTNDDSK